MHPANGVVQRACAAPVAVEGGLRERRARARELERALAKARRSRSGFASRGVSMRSSRALLDAWIILDASAQQRFSMPVERFVESAR